MKIKLSLSLFVCLFSIFSMNVFAETLYLNDKIKVWSRTGPSNAYKLKFQFEPGDKFEVLQKNPETGFVEVKDVSGRTAWVDGKLLISTPTAHQKLVSANAEITSLKKEMAEKTRLLDKRIQDLAPLESLNHELQTKLAHQESELEQLRQKSKVFESGFNSDATMTGAGIILVGMFLGWLLSKIGGAKRHSGWS